MWPVTVTLLPITPTITIWSHSIMWLLLDTSLSLDIPRPVPWPRYAVLHSCGALWQTCVPTFVHSLPHGIMFIPLLTLYFLHSDPMPHASPSLYVPSIWLMLTFPVTPQLALILLQVPIQLVLVFKPLVYPSSNIVCYPHCPLLLKPSCLFSLILPCWVP